jgi:hypothetical protein
MSEINEIAKALGAAHAELKNPPLDSMNPHFRSKFASLAGVRDAVVPVLAKHGLFVSQNLTNTEKGVACTTIITHVSGQQMSFGPLEMPATKQDAQGLGSAATYARRYALLSAFCITGDTDDDANAAVKSNGKDLGAITAQQAADLQALIEEVGANLPRFLAHLKVKALTEIQAVQYSSAVKALEAKRITQ